MSRRPRGGGGGGGGVGRRASRRERQRLGQMLLFESERAPPSVCGMVISDADTAVLVGWWMRAPLDWAQEMRSKEAKGDNRFEKFCLTRNREQR